MLFERPPLSRELPRVALDLARGLAAVLVMMTHVRGSAFVDFGGLPTAQQTPAVAAFYLATRLGGEAVLIFFVLSGYLVFGQILARSSDLAFKPLTYALDRATRIAVPLIPAVALSFLINSIFFHEPVDWVQAVSHILGLHGVLVDTVNRNAPLWSISYEIWFYVVGLAIGCLFQPNVRGSLTFLSLVIALIVFSRLDSRNLLYWLAGGCTFFLISAKARLFPGTSAVVGIIVLACGVISRQIAVGSNVSTNLHLLDLKTSETAIVIGFCLTLPLLTSDRTNALLSPLAGPASRLAAFSFTLYLVHNPINAALDLYIPDPRAAIISTTSVIFFILRVVVCTGSAIILYALFERNTGHVRAWLRRHLRLSRSSLDRRVGA